MVIHKFYLVGHCLNSASTQISSTDALSKDPEKEFEQGDGVMSLQNYFILWKSLLDLFQTLFLVLIQSEQMKQEPNVSSLSLYSPKQRENIMFLYDH